MNLIPLPAFQDNYLWMVHGEHQSLVVNPGDAQPVMSLQCDGLQLEAILVTHHHHPDHISSLDALPGFTRVCCTPEHTLSNLKFARAVEPVNLELINYTQRCEELRAEKLPTLPSTKEQEKRINPFLLTRLPCVAQAVRATAMPARHDDLAVFAAIRQ